jgi:TATA-box binding protein (TBP) (component of TFIID and TFIIIB)
MADLDDDWETFKRNIKFGDDVESSAESLSSLQSCLHISDSSDARDTSTQATPTCSAIYISTTTKIAHLDREIDIKKVFWEIPVIRYVDPVEGVIKKQIKFSTTERTDYDEVMARIANERYCDNQEIEHIDNPEGRIKFKDQRKISVGISKKDILCYRSKKKRAFFNCFVMIIRILSCDEKGAAAVVKESQCVSQLPEFKEMHVKIFNTGKLEIPGIQNIQTLNYVLEVVTRILRPAVSPDLSYLQGECDTVLINSNFNCGFYIDRDKLHELLKYKYRINSNYDSCSYPGIQSKFYYVYGREVQNGQQPHYTKTETKPDFCEISFMIFRTGSVLIVGKCSEEILYVIYNFLKTLLEEEYDQIVNRDHDGCDNNNLIPGSGSSLKKQPNSKIQRRIITCSETHSTCAGSLL